MPDDFGDQRKRPISGFYDNEPPACPHCGGGLVRWSRRVRVCMGLPIGRDDAGTPYYLPREGCGFEVHAPATEEER